MATHENPLAELLAAGVRTGGDWVTSRIYGSSRTDQAGMEEERARFNRINGSGAINQDAAFQRPTSWTEFFFGAPPNTGGATGAPQRPPMLLILAVVGLVAWFVWKKV